MANTVNVSFLVTRNGTANVQNFAGMSYATFVALQGALSGVLSMLQAMGSARVAAAVDGKPDKVIGGDEDLRLELRSDHGGGTSEVVLGYTNISKEVADEISAMMLSAVAGVVSAPASAQFKK